MTRQEGKQDIQFGRTGTVATEKRTGSLGNKDLRAQSTSLQHKWHWRFNNEDGILWR